MQDTKAYVNTFWDYEYDAQGFPKSNTKYEMLDVAVGNNIFRNYSLPFGRFDQNVHLFEYDSNVGQYYLELL